MYVHVVLSAAAKKAHRPLCLISHLGLAKLKYSIDNTVVKYFWTHSLTWRRANCSTRGGGVAEGTSTRKNATATRVDNAGGKNSLFFVIFFFFLCICNAKRASLAEVRPAFKSETRTWATGYRQAKNARQSKCSWLISDWQPQFVTFETEGCGKG